MNKTVFAFAAAVGAFALSCRAANLTEIANADFESGDEAAVLAAQHSRAKDSAQVPVDYTQIRYVSKPQGAKPGMVIYVQYKTVYVDPTTESKAKQQS